MKIHQELRERGIEKTVIQQYLESYSIDWLSHAEAARIKKLGDSTPADCAEKSKQSRFLLNRGFSSQLISQLLS